MVRWLVTGAAGFIGSHLTRALLARGDEVVGLDDLNDYYDPALKRARLAAIPTAGFRFEEGDIAEPGLVDDLLREHGIRHVVNLAAQAGVRHALVDPFTYAHTNLLGFVRVLEACRQREVEHLLYASSSSVYGETSQVPFSVHRPADHPVSLYAATKRANELLAHSYSHLHGLPTTGLRFFTVYGPWGRPDMAIYLFAQALARGEPVRIFGDGSAKRDFTYVDDVIDCVLALCDRQAAGDPRWTSGTADPSTSRAPFRVYNVGRGEQHTVNDMIAELEQALGSAATRVYEPVAPGDVPQTFADVSDLEDVIGRRPVVPLREGLRRFVDWFGTYHGLETAVGAGDHAEDLIVLDDREPALGTSRSETG